MEEQWLERDQLALCGNGIEQGLSYVFMRYAADHLFTAIDQLGACDGANLVVACYDLAASFSIWATRCRASPPPRG